MEKTGVFQKQMEALHRAYVQQLPGKVQQIVSQWKAVCQGAADKSTLSHLYHHVHKLSGSGPTFGFSAIPDKTKHLEEVLKKYIAEGIPPTEEEEQQVEVALSSLKLLAAAVSTNQLSISAQEAPSGSMAVSDVQTAEDAGNYTILVADDEAFLRKKLVLCLRKVGYRVEEAEDGLMALTLARAHPPDVILMDYLMPVMDGLEAIRQLREEEPLQNTPVFLLTTHSKINDMEGMLACDVQGYIAKPFDPLQVIEQVKLALESNGSDRKAGPGYEKKNILIADDYIMYRRKIALTLEQAGFIVNEADNGLMALKQARECHPDLILMDVMMPVMDGLEATQYIRNDETLRDVPIIMLTTNVKMKDVPTAMAYGANSYIAKPRLAEQIVEKVNAYLAYR
ncbi:MAG: response regulator [Rhodothermales bacterium]